MPKPLVAPIAALFLLASALVLTQAAELRTPPGIAVESPSALATVRAYYAAAALYLETGDVSGVREIVAPALLGNGEPDDQHDNLELFLRALRESYPLVSFHLLD